MQTSNPTEHYRKGLHWVTGTKLDCTSAQRLFNWNTSIIGHKHGSVGFPQGEKENYQGHQKTPQSVSVHFLCFIQVSI